MRRTALYIVTASFFGCAALQNAPKKPEAGSQSAETAGAEVAEDEEDYEEDEQGIAGIYSRLRKFRDALEAKKFDRATGWLRRAQRAVQTADVVTQSHPDFDDVKGHVVRAGKQLERALEQDRIERRNAAIDKLMQEGDEVLRKGRGLVTEISTRFPGEEDLRDLADTLSKLAQIQKSGQQYLSEPRFKKYAEQLQKNIDYIAEWRDIAIWQRQAAQQLSKGIDEAFAAAKKLRQVDSLKQRLVQLERAALGFNTCYVSLEKFRSQEEYSPTRSVITKLGELSIGDTLAECKKRAKAAQKRRNAVEWEDGIEEVLGKLSEVSEAPGQEHPEAQLQYSLNAALVFGECKTRLGNLRKHPGHDSSKKLNTPLGSLTADQLRTKCGSKQIELTRAQPKLRWLSAVRDLLPAVDDAASKLEEAKQAQKADPKLEVLKPAIENLNKCRTEAGKLARVRSADQRHVFETTLGKLTIGKLVATCQAELQEAQGRLAKAKQLKKLEAFLASTKGDEVAVARKHGIPARVEDVKGGRIFYYPKGKKFGFKSDGTAHDFDKAWMHSMEAVVAAVSETHRALTQAPTHKQALARAKDAVKAYAGCAQEIDRLVDAPGRALSARFKTPFGKLKAKDIGTACKKQRAKVLEGMGGHEWRAEAEEIVERVNDAVLTLQDASKKQDASERLAMVGRARGSLAECTERGAPLLKDKRADRRTKFDTKLGKLDFSRLLRACGQKHKASQKDLGQAQQALKVQEFLEKSRGDEVAVVKREGVPSKVVEKENGRIFVYSRGRKSKKFGFDKSGKRVDLSLLK